jgi:hypothetical protein
MKDGDDILVWVIVALVVIMALVVNSVPAPIYGDCQDDLRHVCPR